MKNFLHTLAIVSLIIPVTLGAAVMGSSNYKVQSDSVNFGGGFSSSTNYGQESSAGEVATGYSGSASYKLHAGYQQMISTYLSISVTPVSLTPVLNTTGGGIANGSTNVTVSTDDVSGYELYIKASSSPALVSGGNSFADYTPAGASPDFTFSVPAANSEFGFSPEGADIVQKFRDNGSVCNAGSSDSVNNCWIGLSGVDQLIAKSTVGNHPNGTGTTLKFRVESGASHVQPSGVYTATTTVTAVAL